MPFQEKKRAHEPLLVKFLNKTRKDLINGLGYDLDVIGKLAVGTLHKPGKAFIDQIIRSAMNVDKLDLVVRDTYARAQLVCTWHR